MAASRLSVFPIFSSLFREKVLKVYSGNQDCISDCVIKKCQLCYHDSVYSFLSLDFAMYKL